MMLLHDDPIRLHFERRVQALTPESQPRWGKMTVDQMLWHVNQTLAVAAGESEPPPGKGPLPGALMKFLLLNLPWIRNAPTHPTLVARARHDFPQERERCLRLVDAIARRPIEGVWIEHPMFGPMTGRDVSRLQAKHLDHHLKQFGR